MTRSDGAEHEDARWVNSGEAWGSLTAGEPSTYAAAILLVTAVLGLTTE